jgi:hypothetical protein
MRDLQLWRLLRRRYFEPDEIVPLLRDLATRDLNERMPFFGLLPAALLHPSAEVRAAAVAALRGARGYLGLRHIVIALHDRDAAVRLAAVEALRDSLAGDDWPRWAHALFHPDPAVREAALATDRPFPPPEWQRFYLWPDPIWHETVHRQIEALALPGAAMSLLFDYVHRGMIEPPLARRWASRLSWDDWLHWWQNELPGEHANYDNLRQSVWQPDGARALLQGYRFDERIDQAIHLFWESDPPDPPGQPDPSQRFFDLILENSLERPESFRAWLAFTVLCIAVQRKTWHPRAAELIAVLQPEFLACSWVPREVRHAAIAGLHRIGDRCPRIPDERVRPLLQAVPLAGAAGLSAPDTSPQREQGDTSPLAGAGRLCDVCRDDAGRLDPWAVGGILRLLSEKPYQRLLEWVGLDPVVAALQHDVDRALPFLDLTDDGPQGRKHLILEASIRLAAPQRTRFLALLARELGGKDLDVLEALDGQEACQVFGQVLALGEPVDRPSWATASADLADKLSRALVEALDLFLHTWLAHPSAERSWLGLGMLQRLCRQAKPKLLVRAVAGLEPPLLGRFLAVTPLCLGLTQNLETQLAKALADHADEGVRSWAGTRLGDEDGAGLPRARLGLCELLRQRADLSGPSLDVCQLLLGSHDPLPAVAEQFARFYSEDEAFLKQLDSQVGNSYRGKKRLPILAHAWLGRLDQHALAFGALVGSDPGGWAAVLRAAGSFPVAVLRQRFWSATLRLLQLWRDAEPFRLAPVWSPALGEVLTGALTSDVAETAARILLLWRERAPASPLPPGLEGRIAALLPTLPEPVRQLLSPWLEGVALPPTPEPPTTPEPAPSETDLLRRQILGSSDLDFLADCAARPDEAMAAEATRRLVALGEPGVGRLAEVLARVPPPPCVASLAVSVQDWPEGPALEAMRQLVRRKEADPEVRFRVGLDLHERGEPDLLPHLLDAAVSEADRTWFSVDDWNWLRSLAPDPLALAVALVRSPQRPALAAAVGELVAVEEANPEVRRALLLALEAGTEVERPLRRAAAEWLAAHGDTASVLPLLLQDEPSSEPPYPQLLARLPFEMVDSVVNSVLMAGQGEPAEEMLLGLLRADGVNIFAREEAYGKLLARANSQSVRQAAREEVKKSRFGRRSFKLRRVGETFAWGVNMGRQLTGKLFSIEMIAGEQLGYTRFRENKLYITPMPLLRGVPYAREIVRALILHEYGHHMYHRGDASEAVWRQSEQEGLQRLLNLVSDEHLERNLRALDRNFGDMLKMLGSYAFQRSTRELAVENLLYTLQGSSFDVLVGTPLRTARRRGCVSVESGAILAQMERAGMAFARFMRALRMNLGNRHNDPKVAEALALFKGARFRHSTMAEMLEIARKLREIFGAEAQLLESFGQDEALEVDETDLDEAGEGITREEVQRETQRQFDPRRRRTDSDHPPLLPSHGLNLSPEEEFDKITEVRVMPYDPAQHAALAQPVARQAVKMRQYLQKLGIGLEQQRFRLSGRLFDRTRAQAVVLRSDPRMLISRSLKQKTDLFLGVVIDCSGSMSYYESMEKAKRFGALLAEAARGNPGIDLRLFGFTDQVIYDAGNATRCAVHSLVASGGNNDAAGLWHAAQVARASKRKAKLLVMISDGEPTECSVAALKALVERLTRRWKICCAQVAVQPLTEICFPNYVLLEENNLDECVRRFGAVMARLVLQALAGG